MPLTPKLKAKGQLTKANQTKARMENLARELQKVTLTAPPRKSLTTRAG